MDKIHVGDQLTISNAVPYLTVVDVERQSGVQDIPYEVEYQDDSSLYVGDTRVLSAGVYGKADVTANVTYINGEETNREVVASVTLSEPVAELQARGTMERPTWLPTGSFRWPCSGRISSRFGYRNTGIAGASTYHKGIDIGNSYGTPFGYVVKYPCFFQQEDTSVSGYQGYARFSFTNHANIILESYVTPNYSNTLQACADSLAQKLHSERTMQASDKAFILSGPVYENGVRVDGYSHYDKFIKSGRILFVYSLTYPDSYKPAMPRLFKLIDDWRVLGAY